MIWIVFAIVGMGAMAAASVLLMVTAASVRIDAAPRCTACSYDLAGTPQPWRRCTECGADLGAHGAVSRDRSITDWRPFRWMIFFAILALLVSLLALGGP